LRITVRLAFVLAAAASLAAAVSCDDEELSRDLGMSRDGGSGTISPGMTATDAAAETPMSTMRLAHLAPEIGPIDFCYQGAKKGTFIGPVLGGAPSAEDTPSDGDAAADADTGDELDTAGDAAVDAGTGASTRIASYGTVSRYLNLQTAGPITLAILEAGARSCANALATADVTLDPGKLSTVALFARPSDAGTALEIAAFTDDRATQSDKIRVRVVHAALGKGNVGGASSLAVRAVAAKTTILADRVDPRRVSTASSAVMVDGLGYVTAAPVPPPTSIAIGPATTDGGGADTGFETWQSASTDLDLRGGSLHTAFVLTGESGSTFEVLWCADTTTTGDQTTCQLVR
jgi:Domain of unknown function (DUF4397)